jgi:hypothetical protein
LEIEREYTLTPKVQKLNQKVHCRARGRHMACSSRVIATRRWRHTVRKPFHSAADTVGLFVPQAQGCARRQKKFQRSRENHERFVELDIVHNQAFTNSPPPSTPSPPGCLALPLLPPAPPARAPPAQAPPAPQLRRGKTSKVHCTG